MAKNKQRAEQRSEATKSSKARPASSKKSDAAHKNLMWLLMAVCVVLTFIAYIPAINGEFVGWDDPDYAQKNETIRSLSNMKQLMTEPVQGNHHPLTMISLALNYSMSGLNTTSYHILNILLHLANTLLVFWFAWKLSSRSLIIAFAAALFFGVHPMHVESVAWISERKDVLYTFFYMLGLLAYLRYTDSESKAAYALTILCLILSLASKPAAIVFPLSLLTIDLFRRRAFSLKLLLEKLPHLALGAIFAFLTLNAQSTVGATDTSELFVIEQRVFFGFYGFMMYLFKLVLPVNLACFYPLPAIKEALPGIYYVSPLVFAGVAALCISTRKTYPIITWAFAFFAVNLILILQFKVVGSAIIADRYTYVPYISLFMLIGWFLQYFFENKQSTALAIIAIIGVVCTALSFGQSASWKSNTALWDHAIENAPSERAYMNRGIIYRDSGNTQKALQYFNEAVTRNKHSEFALTNRGSLYFDLGMDSLAMADYEAALAIKPTFAQALDHRGALLARLGRSEEALKDLNKAIEINPTYWEAYNNRGTIYYNLKQYEASIKDGLVYLEHEPKNLYHRNLIGSSYQQLGRYEESIRYLSSCIERDPQPQLLLTRAYSYNAIGNLDAARADVVRARQGGMKIDPAFLQVLHVQ